MSLKWWNHKYPFRRQLNFQNVDQIINSGQNLFVLIPKTIEMQGKYDHSILNMAVVFSYREIVKPITAYIQDWSDDFYGVSFPAFKSILPNTILSDYWIYYGSSEENTIVDNVATEPTTGFSIIEDLRSDKISYTPNLWEFVEQDENSVFAVSSISDAKLVLNDFIYSYKVSFLSNFETGYLKYQIDNEPWIEIDTSNNSFEWGVFEIEGKELSNDKHTLRIVNSGKYKENDTAIHPIITDSENVLPENITTLIENNYQQGVVVVTKIEYQKFNRMQVNNEEVDYAMPWSSKLGGSISVTR